MSHTSVFGCYAESVDSLFTLVAAKRIGLLSKATGIEQESSPSTAISRSTSRGVRGNLNLSEG